MNKSEIVDTIDADHDLTKINLKEIVEQVFDFVFIDLKKEGRLSFLGLGAFATMHRHRNPVRTIGIDLLGSTIKPDLRTPASRPFDGSRFAEAKHSSIE